MKTSASGIAFIAGYETFRAEPYQDRGKKGGVWTIGYGHTGGVTAASPAITPQRASELLAFDVSIAERAVTRLAVKLEQHEWDALVSLAFNIGNAHFETSTLVRQLTSGDRGAAAKEFTKWHFDEGEPSLGLFKRRLDEREMFLKGDYTRRA